MPTLPSRSVRDCIGMRFRALADEQEHSPPCTGHGTCNPRCRTKGNLAPVITRSIWFNDVCGRDAALYTRLHYSDGVQRPEEECAEFIRARGDRHRHLGVWPYALVEIAFEITRDRIVVDHFHRDRFKIEDLRDPFPPAFLRAASELRLERERFVKFIRLHADPRVEEAIPSTF